jgi:hypothetical protein
MQKVLGFVIVLLGIGSSIQAGETIFVPVKIDGPVHDPAKHSYWYGPFCEAASVADLDGDGDLDIASGRNWYEAPNWIKHTDYRDGAETNGPEVEDNSEFGMDVNFDGHMDIVSSGWMFMKGAFWYENPGDSQTPWVSRRIHMAENMEGVIPGDIDGDGDDDILVNHWALVPGQGMTWLEHIDQAPWFVEHVIGREVDSHGNGLGDINGDGRPDIVTRTGWYEQPASDPKSSWVFHGDYDFFPAKGGYGSGSHPMLVHDVNEDGLNDIIIGQAHAYGLAWLEQKMENGRRTFETHWIETEYSQFHTMELGDLNGDGKEDLVTGKRLFAHHGDDIGSGEPLFAFWYDLNGGDIERHILSFNHLPHYPLEQTNNPPPNFVVSVGMKIQIEDLNQDGRNDVIIAGKGGLYVFYNNGNPPTLPIADKLIRESGYPTWREWYGHYVSYFNGKDFTGWQVPEGDNGHWTVKDGVIDYDALSEAPGGKHLLTEESFRDYRLHIEWRFKEKSGLYPMKLIQPDGSYKKDANGKDIIKPAPNADSGIIFRGSGGQANLWCWPVGSGELWSVRNNESLLPHVRAAAVPLVRADNPVGEWNSMDVTLINDHATIRLNGKLVIDNALVPDLPKSGPIGLQHHGGMNKKTGEYSPASSRIQFKNILIKKIEPGSVPAVAADDGWETLFDGGDLSSFRMGPERSWVVEDGVITVKRNEYDGKEHNQDYLWTKNLYDDFVLEVECKVTDKTNSGIYLRTPNVKDPVYTGIEVQVSDCHGKPISIRGTAGAIYECLMPTKNMMKPAGEWNKYIVTCIQNKIIVELNGEQVIDMDLDLWDTPNQNPDGKKNKFGTALKNFARTGYVGFQDHGRQVWYRNIRIKRL